MLLCSKCSGTQANDTADWDGGSGSNDEESVNIDAPWAVPGHCGVDAPCLRQGSECESASTDSEEGPGWFYRVGCGGSTAPIQEKDTEWESTSASSDEDTIQAKLAFLGLDTDIFDVHVASSKLSRIVEEDSDDGVLNRRGTVAALGCVRRLEIQSPASAEQVGLVLSHRKPRAKGTETQRLLRCAVVGDQLCSTLSAGDVERIVGSMEFLSFGSGETVVRQGEPGYFFFAVHEGELGVLVDGDEVNGLSSGRTFGSLALLYNCPRNATVVARSDVGLWACDGRAFRAVVRANAQRYHQEHRAFVDSITLFDGLSAQQKDRLAEAFLPEVHGPGVEVVREGDVARSMYLVKKGKLQVLIGDQMVQLLGNCDCFGERALLYDEPRCATVRTVTTCELLCVSYSQLQAVLGQDLSPRLLKRNLLLTGLRCSPVFSRFSPTQQLALVEHMSVESFQPHAPVDLPEFGVVIEGEALAPRFAGLGSRRLRRGQWFGHASLVEGPAPGEPEAARGQLIRELRERLLEERRGSRGLCISELGQLTAGERGCSMAVLTAANLARSLKSLGMSGVGSAGTALDYARRMQALSEIYIFQHLSQKQTDKLINALMLHRYEAGALVLKQGERGNAFYAVASGELGVFVRGERVRTLGKGAYFGERALLFEEPRAAAVQVISERAEVWSVTTETFRQIVKGRLKEQLMDRVVLHDPEVRLIDLRHVRVIGSGSFGVVRLVTHTRTGVKYALKRVKKIGGVLPSELVYECEMLAELDHPLMVYLVKTLETAKHVYMLTEFLSGGDLYSALRKLGWALPSGQARFYAGCIASAVEALHDRGIVYRDLKPQNIMLDRQGYPKLIDFGTAKRLKGSRTYTAIGTPYYISPEILEGRGYATEVDLWSFGVLLYELVCGRYPFGDGENDVNKVYIEVLKAPLAFPARVRDCSARELIQGLLQRKPEQRLGSGLCGWEEIREADFFKEGESGGQSLFDRLRSRECEPPLVPHGGDEAGEVCRLNPRMELEADLSDAHEFAR